MDTSLELDTLTQDDLRRLLEDIVNRLPAQELLALRNVVEATCQEKRAEDKQALLQETQAKLTALGAIAVSKPPVLWRGGDVADNPAWRCTETRCSYSVQQRGELREDDDRPGWPRGDVLVSPHVPSTNPTSTLFTSAGT